MTFTRRISTIYVKELIDILRDRRTLIAMIAVPIVLYPLLMLGSVQAVSYQKEAMEQEALVIGVAGDRHRIMLSQLIQLDVAALAREKARLDPESSPNSSPHDSRVVRLTLLPRRRCARCPSAARLTGRAAHGPCV